MSAPPRPRRRMFYGWWVVACGAGIELLVGALMQQAFGGYAAALTREFGWSRSAIGIGFSLSRLENGILGPLQGWLIDRFGPRAVIRAGLVLLSLGFLLFSQTNSLWMFYVTFGLMALGAGLAGFMAITVAVVNWFDRYRARALGMAQIGFAVGGLIAPLVILGITQYGWREMAIVSAVLILVLGLPVASFIHSRPEDIGLRMDGLTLEEETEERERDRLAHRTSHSTEVDYTAREALRTPAFWLISLGHAMALTVVSAVMVHLFLHLTESLQYSDAQAASFIGLMTVFQIVGQLVGGYLGDRINKRIILCICMGMHASGVLLVAHVPALWGVLAFAVLHGAAWGGRGPLQQALRADYFGRTSFGMIMGFSSMITMVGTVFGPVLAGVLFDRTGSYTSGFTVLAIIAAFGSLAFAFAKRPPLPVRPAEPQPEAVSAGD
ncbi:MAG: MFS transporter [Dehalococcoidia bacterium]